MRSKNVVDSTIAVLSLAFKHAEMPGSKSETQHTVNVWDGFGSRVAWSRGFPDVEKT